MTPKQKTLSIVEDIAKRHTLALEDVMSRRRNRLFVNARIDIAHALKERGMNQTETARVLDVHPSSVSHLLRTPKKSVTDVRRRRQEAGLPPLKLVQ